jgi:predicted RNA-binding protein with PUA-like domain
VPARADGSAREPRHWLVKTEPSSFSWDDLERSPNRTTVWDGVRNYQARNFMRDGMKVGDLVLFYHSSTDPAAVVGIAEVVRDAYPDHTAFDANDPHFDPKSRREEPTWMMVDIRAVERFARPVPLEELKRTKGLEKMELLRKGNRLSVQPVTAKELETVWKLGKSAAK